MPVHLLTSAQIRLKRLSRDAVYKEDLAQLVFDLKQANPEAEVNAVKELATEAIAAGFYNIDVDTSTLVDLSQPTIPYVTGVMTTSTITLKNQLNASTPSKVSVAQIPANAIG